MPMVLVNLPMLKDGLRYAEKVEFRRENGLSGRTKTSGFFIPEFEEDSSLGSKVLSTRLRKIAAR